MYSRVSEYWKNIAIVFTGTIASQLIPVLSLPILAKYLSVDDIGTYLKWIAFGSIFTVFAKLSIDSAIFNARNKYQITNLLRFSLLSGILFTILCGLIASIFYLAGFSVLGFAPIDILLIGAYACLTALNNCMIATFVYDGHFTLQSYARLGSAASPTIGGLIAVAIDPAFNSLVLGHVSGLIVGAWIVFRMLNVVIVGEFKRRSFKKLIRSMLRWQRFPALTLPAQLIGSFSSQAPLIAIGYMHGAETAAHYGIAMRTIAIPIGLLAGALQTVFRAEAAREYRLLGNCKQAYLKALKHLVAIALSVSPLLFFASDLIFVTIYGEAYKYSADITLWLLPCIALGVVASPLGFTLIISNRQHVDLIWQILLIGLVILSFGMINQFSTSIKIYSAGYTILYVIYLYQSWRSTGVK